MGNLYQTTYHGFTAWALENSSLLSIIVPALGGKIVSLRDRRTGCEWLVGPARALKPLDYGASFVKQDMSGWDEMFPTIEACEYSTPGAYAGRWLPDHGEVWSLPWSVMAADQDRLELGVEGRALPYRLSRTASLVDPEALKLQYTLLNTGEEPFDYLWTAHPQFNAGEESLILLPDSVSEVVNVLPSSTWGEGGLHYPWPEAQSKDGTRWRLDRIGGAERQDCRKFYLPPDSPVRWAALVNQRLGCSLRMEWSPEELPYLGVWVDEGAFNTSSAVALEPSSGFYDNLTLACRQGRARRIDPCGTHHWSLTVRLINASLGS